MRKHSTWIWIVTIGVIVCAALTTFWLRDTNDVGVTAAETEYHDVNATVSTDGKVTPVVDFQAVASFSGFVGKVFVKLGDHVQAGEMVVQEKDPFAGSRYASAKAALQGAIVGDENVRRNGSQEDRINMSGDLARAETEQEDAAKSLETLKTLQANGGASAGEISGAEHRLRIANETLSVIRNRIADRYSKSEVVNSEDRIEDARAAVESARIVLSNANIVSPVSGTVYAVQVSTNDFVQMGAPLLSITDLNKMQVRAYFDEPDIGSLAKGQAVDLAWNARPNKKWHGHIMQVPLTVSSLGPRIVGQCVIAVDDANGELLPNTNITVTVYTDRRIHVLTVPREALHIDGSDRFVFRILNGKLTKTPVRTGIVNLTQAEILNGLKEHDVVALHAVPTHELSDSLPVKLIR